MEELPIKTIKLNKGKARDPCKHLQVVEQLSQIFKATMDTEIVRVTTPTAPITPTASHSPTHKGTVTTSHKSISITLAAILQSCPQIHQPQQLLSHMSPKNHHTYSTMISPKMTKKSADINFIQHQVQQIIPFNLHVMLPPQSIENISSVNVMQTLSSILKQVKQSPAMKNWPTIPWQQKYWQSNGHGTR